MFERFNSRAQSVLVWAQDEARLLNHSFIGTEHILLGVAHESDGIAVEALSSIGITLEAVRLQVEEFVSPAGSSTTGSPPFTPRSKRVLDLSVREGLDLGHDHVGPEHLLLGLIREGEGVGARTLVALGADLVRLRHHVRQLLADHPSPPAEPSPPSGRERRPEVTSRTPWQRVETFPRASIASPLEAGSVSVSGAVELTRRRHRIIGSAGGRQVDMSLAAGGGDVTGTCADLAVSIRLKVGGGAMWHPDVPVSLHGTFGDGTVRLLAWLHLKPDYRFAHARIEGEALGQPVSLHIDSGDPEADAFTAHGAFGGISLSCRGAVRASGAELTGAASGHPVRLRADRVDQAVTLTGTYTGPAPLLLLMVGSLLHFI